ncbi:spermidine synthase [Cohnella terricola]|uniref:Spermidine synthase n=1 Tax=Cohnella terricola TaxID=1289167 RepID=A0A559JQ26_9BACL|nr:fused MFS/spermidine synthase [Cohnella terricola]TVY01979.1 spermidine synthase [Cohnella terricola]
MSILETVTSPYNDITVYETNMIDGLTGRYRCLRFADDAVQGALDLKNRQRVVLGYQRAIIGLMETLEPSFENAFVIGHGIGTIADFFRDRTVKTAEIDEAIVELSRKYFHSRADFVAIGDGRQLLGEELPGTLDFIILDAFTDKGTPLHLMSSGFFQLAAQKLNPGGAILFNAMGKPKNDRLVDAIHTTIRKSFAYVKVFSLPVEKETDIRNMIFVGSDKPLALRVKDVPGLHEVVPGEGHLIQDH